MTCRNIWKSTPSPGSSARPRAMWATRRAASSPSRSAAGPTAWCSLTRSKRPTRTSGDPAPGPGGGHPHRLPGRKADFRNAIVVLTSNVGAQRITARGGRLGFSAREAGDGRTRSPEELKEEITGELKKVFRPELLQPIGRDHRLYPAGAGGDPRHRPADAGAGGRAAGGPGGGAHLERRGPGRPGQGRLRPKLRRPPPPPDHPHPGGGPRRRGAALRRAEGRGRRPAGMPGRDAGAARPSGRKHAAVRPNTKEENT